MIAEPQSRRRRALMACAVWVAATAFSGAGCGKPRGPILGRDLPRPVVKIESPADRSLIPAAGLAASVTVSGTVGDDAVSVTVKGQEATIAEGRFVAEMVSLREGDNLIVAQAVSDQGGVGADSVVVQVDRTAPQVTVTYPADGAEIFAANVTVIGGAVDLVTGGEAKPLAVKVNGRDAEVGNMEFTAVDVSLVEGEQEIRAVATDSAGNRSEATVKVKARIPNGQTLSRVSGDNQVAVAGTTLPDSLVVVLKNPQGQPVPGRRVTFAVERGDGELAAGTAAGREVVVQSGTDGTAAAVLKVARRAGAGANLVRATALGFEGEALFVATGIPGAAVRMVMDDGDNQAGCPGERLARPLGVKVLDELGNAIADAPVLWLASPGDRFEDGRSAITARTDVHGISWVVFRLGPEEGLSNHWAEVEPPSNDLPRIRFQASAIYPGVPEETRVTGEVLSMVQQPIVGARVRVIPPGEQASQSTSTDEQGRFAFTGVVPGLNTILVDPADVADGPFPSLSFDLLAIAGRENKLPRAIYLPKLDKGSAITVDDKTGGTLHMADVTGVELVIAPGSATFLDGSKSGQLTLSQVNNERIPMSPPGGVSLMVVGALQPAGVRFNPPARLRFPNVDNLAPGQVVDIVTFDHDMNRFVTVGTAKVEPDGKTVLSEPGQGMPFAGWHSTAPPPPPPTRVEPCIPPDLRSLCPSSSPNAKPIDPKILGRGMCRGACGVDCPSSACSRAAEPEVTDRCVAGPETGGESCTNTYHGNCTYEIQRCLSHPGCREHDACYDLVAAVSGGRWTCASRSSLLLFSPGIAQCLAGGLHPSTVRDSCCQCDNGCTNQYGTLQCFDWSQGRAGTNDGPIDFSSAPLPMLQFEGGCP